MALILADIPADLLCLLLMLRVTGRRIRPLRMALSAVLGAFAAQGVRMLAPGRGQMLLLWLLTALAMSAVACGRVSLSAALTLLSCAGLLGGTVYALAGATGSLALAWGIGAACVLAMAARAVCERRRAQDARMLRVRITYGGKTAALAAMADSGNCLRDYLTHRPVIVLPDAARARLGLQGAVLRPIFADTAGGRQMMACFTPQATVIETGGRRLEVRACAAFSPGLRADAPALVPQSLLDTDCEAMDIADKEGDAYGKAEG